MSSRAESADDAAALIAKIARPILKLLAREIADELGRRGTDTMIDQGSVAALEEMRISRRVYLAAARAQEFPTRRRGRRIVAQRSVVEHWLEHRGQKATPAPPISMARPIDDGDDVRAALGVAPKRARR